MATSVRFQGVDGIDFIDSEGRYCENNSLQRIRKIDDIPRPDWPDGYMEKFWHAGKPFGVGTKRDMPLMILRGVRLGGRIRRGSYDG